MTTSSGFLNQQNILKKLLLLLTIPLLLITNLAFGDQINELASEPLKFIHETFETGCHTGLQIVYGHLQSLKQLAKDLEVQGKKREAQLVRREAVMTLAKYKEIRKSSPRIKKTVVILDKSIILPFRNGVIRFHNLQQAGPLKSKALKRFFEEFAQRLVLDFDKSPILSRFFQLPLSLTAAAQVKFNPIIVTAYLMNQTPPDCPLFPIIIKSLNSICKVFRFERNTSFLFSISIEPLLPSNKVSLNSSPLQFIDHLYPHQSNAIFSQILVNIFKACNPIQSYQKPF